MYKQIVRMMLVATFFLMVVGASSIHAQNGGTMTVNIPFEFVAGSKTLPPGQYYVRRDLEAARVVVQIRSNDGSQPVYVQTHTVQGRSIQDDPKLIFNRYGHEYFLAQVWMSGRSSGEELSKTSRERSLQRDLTRRRIETESVAINGKSN